MRRQTRHIPGTSIPTPNSAIDRAYLSKALTAAAQTGVLENVRINLDAIKDEAFRASVETRLRAFDVHA